jgi:hypothetical protein
MSEMVIATMKTAVARKIGSPNPASAGSFPSGRAACVDEEEDHQRPKLKRQLDEGVFGGSFRRFR